MIFYMVLKQLFVATIYILFIYGTLLKLNMYTQNYFFMYFVLHLIKKGTSFISTYVISAYIDGF